MITKDVHMERSNFLPEISGENYHTMTTWIPFFNKTVACGGLLYHTVCCVVDDVCCQSVCH